MATVRGSGKTGVMGALLPRFAGANPDEPTGRGAHGTVCPDPGAGPFVASADLFTALVAELEGPGTAGLTACELEDLLAERGREVQRQRLQDHLDLRAAREEQAVREHPASATGADGITRRRGDRPRQAAGHAVRHGAGHPVRLAPPGDARSLPGRRGVVAAACPATPMPWPGWPRWKPPAARSRPRTPRSPAAAGR